jgi:hypothetical protein
MRARAPRRLARLGSGKRARALPPSPAAADAAARAVARGAQVCTTLVLAGVGSVSLLDNAPASRAAPGNFLVPCDAPADATCAPRGAPAPRAPAPAPQRP